MGASAPASSKSRSTVVAAAPVDSWVAPGWGHVDLVLEEDLPVGLLDHAEAVADDLAFAGRGAVDELVEGGLRAAEMGFEIGAVGGQRGEPEAAIVVRPGRLPEAKGGIVAVETGAGVAVLGGDALEPAVELEHPRHGRSSGTDRRRCRAAPSRSGRRDAGSGCTARGCRRSGRAPSSSAGARSGRGRNLRGFFTWLSWPT